MAALSSTSQHVHDALLAAPRAVVPRVSHGPQHVAPASSGAVALAVARPSAEGQYEALALNAGEAIRGLTMKLKNNGWFSSKSCIVFGDRELADDLRTSNLVPAAAHPSYLHVFVKLGDVESVTIRTLMRELSLSSPASAEQQFMHAAASGGRLLALPCSSAHDARAAASSSSARCASATAGGGGGGAAASATVEEAADSATAAAQDAFDSAAAADRGCHGKAVVHLCIHKSARVNWAHNSDNKFTLSIDGSDAVDSLMRKIEAANGLALEPAAADALPDSTPAASAGQPLASYTKGAKLELVPLRGDAGAGALPDGSPTLASPLHGLHSHWQAARAGLNSGLQPTLAKAGTGGSYFLQDVSGRPVAVFKPQDEEPLAVNNPKGRGPGSAASSDGSSSGSSTMSSGGSGGSEGLRRGTRPGEGAVREVAAYVLDHGHFSGVPPTALVSAYLSDAAASSGDSGAAAAAAGVKVGSLQQFVESEGDCEERGYSGFPVSEVHKIAVLDLRLANTDRNASNVLWRRSADGVIELIPIDHGYCLPSTFEDIAFEWMYWPQAEQPFSAEARAYIAGLDADRDLATLAAHGIALRPECERVFRVCTLVLQRGAAAGLSPSQIAGVLCREGLSRSVIEKLHSNAVHLARAGASAASRSSRSSSSSSSVVSSRASHSSAGSVPLAAYMAQLECLLGEYLEEFLLDGASELLF